MTEEIITKKVDQIRGLLDRLDALLAPPFEEFRKDFTAIAAAERNFQLLVDIASDLNTQIMIERKIRTADTYQQSFARMADAEIIPRDLAERLIAGAKIRNILVHEYDFEEDYEKFYVSAKELVPVFREYARIIYAYVREHP